ncbi:MAG: NAD(P)-dependent oxidoreductase [Candidatus Peribacter sp.]|nr:NAD(P)-dependent oxidoreductase [Candidatus Peribacter sp.]
MKPLPAVDLESVLADTRDLWEEFRGNKLFLTGATGFMGCWLLESFAWACDHLGLDAHVVALTRDPDRFAAKAPHLASHPSIALVQGDVRSFTFPAGSFSHIIHGAAQPSAATSQPLQREIIVEGTRRVLTFGRACGASKSLFLSSGAVYGTQPPSCSHMPEDETAVARPLTVPSAYADGKREAERLWREEQAPGQRTIARCFAFLGPHLPLDGQFAAGNFIRDGLNGGPIRVNGDGTPFRSYLYAADLVVWLLTILCKGTAGRAYNVGSEQAVSILELAHSVAAAFSPKPAVSVLQKPVPGAFPARYVPSTLRARTELHLKENFPLASAIQATVSWYATD